MRGVGCWCSRRTFSDLDLGAGVTLGHIFDTSHYLGHDGRFKLSFGRMLRAD